MERKQTLYSQRDQERGTQMNPKSALAGFRKMIRWDELQHWSIPELYTSLYLITYMAIEDDR